MKVFKLPLRFGRRRGGTASPVGGVLQRVRAMRESCVWPPLTTPSTVDERRHRVAQVRERIRYEPTPYEPLEKAPYRDRILFWLLFVIPLVVLSSGIVWILVSPVGRLASGPAAGFSAGFAFYLPVTPSFLSESLALAKATEAFAVTVGNTNGWTPVIPAQGEAITAPDGTPDVYFSRLPGD